MTLETTQCGWRELGNEAIIDWATVPVAYSDDEALHAFDPLGGGTAYSGGPGRPYARRATIRRSKGHCLVTQVCGLDI